MSTFCAAPPGWDDLTSQGADLAASWRVDGVQPHWLVQPQTVEDAARALADARQAGLAVAPFGGGTQMGLGQPPSRLDAVLCTTALDRVVEYEPADLTVTVEAGLRLTALQELLRPHGQFLPLDPPARPGATVGGLVATNASGPLRYAFGTARDLVLGTRVSQTDGTLTRSGGKVVKNVAGYDINKLHVGGLGTLGLLVELSLKLVPIPPCAGVIAVRLLDTRSAAALLADLVHSTLAPLALELLAPRASELVGLPSAYGLLVRVGGQPTAVARQTREIQHLALARGGEIVESESGQMEAPWERLSSLSQDATPDSVLLKATAPIGQAAALVELLEQKLADFLPVVWAEAGNGVAHARLGPGADAATLLDARAAVERCGGNASLVVEQCPSSWKKDLDVWGASESASLAVMRALKNRLAPSHTLNPGRFVGGI